MSVPAGMPRPAAPAAAPRTASPTADAGFGAARFGSSLEDALAASAPNAQSGTAEKESADAGVSPDRASVSPTSPPPSLSAVFAGLAGLALPAAGTPAAVTGGGALDGTATDAVPSESVSAGVDSTALATEAAAGNTGTTASAFMATGSPAAMAAASGGAHSLAEQSSATAAVPPATPAVAPASTGSTAVTRAAATGTVPAAAGLTRPAVAPAPGRQAASETGRTATGLPTAVLPGTVAQAAPAGTTLPVAGVASGGAPSAPVHTNTGTPATAGAFAEAFAAALPASAAMDTASPSVPAATAAAGVAGTLAAAGEAPAMVPNVGAVAQPTIVASPAAVSAAPAPVPTPLLPQVSQPLFSLATAAQGEHTMTLSITPDNLGPVTVRAHVGADGVRIELFAPSEAGREALRTLMTDLRRDLAGSGMNANLSLSSQDAPGSGADRGEGDGPADPGAAAEAGRTAARALHPEDNTPKTYRPGSPDAALTIDFLA